MKTSNKNGVAAALRTAAMAHCFLTVGVILCVAASVAASLLPPLLLARCIDNLTAGLPLTIWAVLAYFASLALEGVLSSAQESLLVVFGQKMTHALRSEMSYKLTRLPAATLVDQNPGEVTARFSGDVDTVEALFTSGIISMVADAVAAVSGQVPETLHNIRTIRALGMEAYMERRYDQRIADSYSAMERTNFYDAIYSPAVLTLNAVVVGIVMLLSASGNSTALALFGMSVGTSVAVINYISRIFAPIESLGMEIQTIQSAMAGVKRIDAFLAQPERTIPAERTKAARGDVEMAHVTFGYGEKHVLNDFSMTVKQGEQVTLVGRTGAGKSTVFKLLLYGYDRRRECGSHHGSRAPHLHQLRGTALRPRARHGAGSNHAGRPADYRRNGEERRKTGGHRHSHCGHARGVRYRVQRGDVLPGRVAAAVHRPGRGGGPRRPAPG